MKTNTLLAVLAASVLILSLQPAFAGQNDPVKSAKAQKKRHKIDEMEKKTLKKLFGENSKAKRLFDRSYGYAVFDNTKVAFIFTGGGGSGVAIDKTTGKRTYMRMGTGGVGLGLGAQVYRIIFLFQDKTMLDNFTTNGWQADASANAVAGRKGANAEATFINGLAIFQMTGGGLMLQADIAGTRYWKSEKLN